MSENTCVCCGEIIPEGTQVCPRCRSARVGSKLARVEKGLECCQVSMGDDEPFAKCGVCPYRDDGIDVEDCRAVLCREALEVIREAETIAQIMARLTDEELIEMLPYIRDENGEKVSLIELKHILREAIK